MADSWRKSHGGENWVIIQLQMTNLIILSTESYLSYFNFFFEGKYTEI